jgi:hypothetical protein
VVDVLYDVVDPSDTELLSFGTLIVAAPLYDRPAETPLVADEPGKYEAQSEPKEPLEIEDTDAPSNP